MNGSSTITLTPTYIDNRTYEEIVENLAYLKWEHGESVHKSTEFDALLQSLHMDRKDVDAKRLQQADVLIKKALQIHNLKGNPFAVTDVEIKDTVDIPLDLAKEILIAIGHSQNVIETMGQQRVQTKLNTLNQWEETVPPDDEELRAIFNTILVALEKGEKVSVISPPYDPESSVPRIVHNPILEGRRLRKREHGRAFTLPEKDGTTEPTAFDAFGCVVGSTNAIVNAALSHIPKQHRQLVKETGLRKKQVGYCYLKKMVEEGKIGRNEKGYFLLGTPKLVKVKVTKKRRRVKKNGIEEKSTETAN